MRRVSISRAFAAAAVVAVGCLVAAPAYAAQLTAVPSISLGGVWDSNIFETSSDEQSDIIVRATPGLALYFDAFQTKTEISGRFEFEWYNDYKELEDNPSTIDLRLAAAEPMRITPRFYLTPFIGFLETSDSFRRTELISPPEPGIPPSNQIITGRDKRRDYRAGITMRYLISPRFIFALGGGATKSEYLSARTDQGQVDTRTIFGDSSLEYQFNPRFSSGAFLKASFDTYTTSPDSQTMSAGLQGTYKIEQFYTLTGRAGVSHSQQDAGPTSPEIDDWVPVASLSFNYSKKDFSATLAATSEPTGGSGIGFITNQFTVYLYLTDQFAERWWWSLTGSYQKNKSIEGSTDESYQTFWGGAGIRYYVRKWASFYVNGSISRQRDDVGTFGDIDRETVYAGVELRTPYIY
jgi:hypothetical protein